MTQYCSNLTGLSVMGSGFGNNTKKIEVDFVEWTGYETWDTSDNFAYQIERNNILVNINMHNSLFIILISIKCIRYWSLFLIF